ncbi:hypothetical protein GXW74_00850 [Roseomonas eburnea]|uniref:Uncharacterized protein n=1 Tax=Neoroseomonas eburnea TaxID=1346889 RepID=A0A9X9X5N4_9PROT|nr:hypothetical protein [Neoroseomonas eburnea]MBR0679020.1 hypothetical protein [Neoroseomonas eburnea]
MIKAIAAATLTVAVFAGQAIASEPARLPDRFAGLAPLGAEELAAATGRAGLDAEAANQALLQGNQVGANSVTGGNTISGSLNGNAGVTTVFQNTGNNTVFQAATSISISVR